MAYRTIGKPNDGAKTIMIFLEGTIFKTKFLLHRFSINGYAPIGECASLINGWHAQGAHIVYCTYLPEKRIAFACQVLQHYGLTGEKIYYRAKGEKYKNLTETVKPDVLIEDDCKSIGGAWQMCITDVAPEIKSGIKSIVVKEFSGIDDLPRNLEELLK